MLRQLYSFQTTTGLYMASLKTGHLPKWTYLNVITCVLATQIDGLSDNVCRWKQHAAIINVDPDMCMAHGRQGLNCESHQSVQRSAQGWGRQSGSSTAVESNQVGCCRRWVFPWVLQAISRQERHECGGCILSSYVASIKGAERTLFSGMAPCPPANANPFTLLQHLWRRAAWKQCQTPVHLQLLH